MQESICETTAGSRSIMLPDSFDSIGYLEQGSKLQRSAYAALRRCGVMELLQKYDPVLVGTIPIHLSIADSDLDILCEVHDLDDFVRSMASWVKEHKEADIHQGFQAGIPYACIRFYEPPFVIEIFSQPVPVRRQNGYRHMLIEAKLLRLGGRELADRIRRLKQVGYKTEPAFAKLLSLEGDPYEALLQLENDSDERLAELISTTSSSNMA